VKRIVSKNQNQKRNITKNPNQRYPNQDFSQGGRNKMMTGKSKPGFKGGRRQDRKQDRNPSLAVDPEWELLQEFDMVQLQKLQANLPTTIDLVTCGHVDQYDDSYDKLTTRSASKLRKNDNKIFYYYTSKDDPILEKFAVEGQGNIFATDSIIAQLMAAPRSVYSWDIVVQKLNGIVFLDKRDDSNFDSLTVSETAVEPPTAAEDIDEYNHPEKLSQEATAINQYFTQQVLLDPADADRKTVSILIIILIILEI
jgi:translation initiation factor 3 subunit D